MSAEPTLTVSEERQILDEAPDAMIVVGGDSIIRYANRQATKLFGWPAEELVGQRLEKLIPTRFQGAHSHHVDRFMSTPVARPMGSGLELFGKRRDGTEIQIEVSLSPVNTDQGKFVAAAIRDIADRKRMESLTRVMAERLASAVESIQDGFALFDANDTLVQCNSVYRALIGDLGDRLSGPLVGRRYEEILTAWIDNLDLDDAQREAFRRERLDKRGGSQTTFDIRTRDGRSLRVTDRQTPEGGIVKIISDRTEDVAHEVDLRDARVAAEAGSAAKSEFLSSMSHELRTPLNAILGFAQLLERDKKEPLSQRQKDRAQQVIKGGEHLLRLIDDILDLSRIEAGRVSISREPVDVVEVIGEVRTTLSGAAEKNGVVVTVVPADGDAPLVSADRTRLSQILMNFGSNAIKYNRAGGSVTLRLVLTNPKFVRVEVSDTGFGVPPEQQKNLFQPFQRAGQETGPIEGTGIGLVITKRLAELMGGRVGFTSTFGQGSTFWVELPVERGQTEQPAVSKSSVAIAQSEMGTQRKRLLYVEDNPANVAFMRDLLDELEVIDLLTAPSAEMGIELALRSAPDIVILDINLPGLSGFDALKALRADPKTKAIPVIALTAAASDRDKERGKRAGFDHYLTKPVKVDELVSALRGLLGRART